MGLSSVHKKFTFGILLVFCLLNTFRSFSQLSSPQPKFHNFTVEDGLPGSETYFVHQDKKGYIWICTDRGVARYDGYKFQVYTTNNGLTDNVVFKIYEDYKGRLWFITYNSTLCYFENEKMHVYKYNDLIYKNLDVKIAPQKTLYIDKNDNVYLSVMLNGLLIIDAKGNLKKYNNGTEFSIKEIEGRLMWIYDEKDIKTNRLLWTNLYSVLPKKRKIGVFGTIARVNISCTKTTDYLLINQQLYDLQKNKLLHEENSAISLYTKDNSLWIGTFKNGIKHFPDEKNLHQSHQYLKGLSISSVLCDNEGGYWFTSLEKGVFYTPSLSIKNYTMYEGLFDDEITSIAGIKNNIYIGFLLKRWQNLGNPKFSNNSKEGDTHVILGNSGRKFYLSYFESRELINGKPGKESFSGTSDFFNEGNAVVFGGRNIYRRYDSGKLEMLYNSLKDDSPNTKNVLQTIMVDKQNRLWIGCLSGLLFVDNQRLSVKGLNDPLFKARVSDLECHPIWKNIVATRGEGVYFFENKKIIQNLTTRDGLLSDLINRLFIDENNGIWVATNKGLNHLTRDEKGKLHIESFTTLHGLCSNEIYALYAYNGIVYAATKGGLSVIDTKTFTRNRKNSDVHITSLETNTSKLDPKKHNTFSYRESYIKIAFRNSNYRSLQKGFYHYRFTKQSKWIATEIPEISLINPLPGEYNLEVRYLNEDGIWSNPRSICDFTIEEAFYKKTYFLIAMSLVFASIVWILFRYRIRQLKQRHRLNNKISQLEQKALQAQMNPHFIFNALNSIQSFLVYEENEKAEKYLLKFAQLIRQTLNNSREPYVTIENEIEILEKYLDLERMRFRNKFTYKISNELNIADMKFKIPTMLIQPFVENAVIHGFSTLDSGGEINISLRSIDVNQILCIIEDNGIGRKKAMQQSSKTHVSFGTTITEERLKAFETKHGIHFKIETIDIENPDGTTGTRILINLPVI